jgi:hypothetical protein
MVRLPAPLLAVLSATAALAACTPTLGPPPPGYHPAPPPGAPAFDAGAFAWSQAPGKDGIAGHVGFTQNGVAYGCAGASVILTPETAWSRRRMEVLYGSADQAAAPTDEVRARTPEAPAGDSTPYIKRATCDPTDKFSFRGLPDGAWFVITLAKPKTGGSGSLAMMKRVTTKGGKVTPVAF